MSGRNYGLRHARAVVNAAFESHDGGKHVQTTKEVFRNKGMSDEKQRFSHILFDFFFFQRLIVAARQSSRPANLRLLTARARIFAFGKGFDILSSRKLESQLVLMNTIGSLLTFYLKATLYKVKRDDVDVVFSFT